MKSYIIIKSLCKTYGEIAVVNNLDIRVNRGELVAILGPSGCGKSTLLYLLAGIVEPTSGDICVDDVRINELPIEQRNVGFVFQNYSLYPHMTVMENLMFPLLMIGTKKPIALEQAETIAELLRIDTLLKRKPKELSGGQQQRVAIGRALIKKPRVLLMDEPFSNLDAVLRVEMRDEIKEIQKMFQITTLFVTHDQEEALSLSDRILLMNDGRCIQYATGEDLYNHPNSLFTASFIGNPKINILQNSDEFLVEKFKVGKTIGIRPEDIRLLQENEDVGEPRIKGHIIEVQQLGRETHFKVKVRNTVLRGLSNGDKDVLEGQKVMISFRKLHYFEN